MNSEKKRDFTTFFDGLDDGDFARECAEKLRDLVRGVESREGKAKAKLTIELTLSKEKKGSVDVETVVKSTPPKPLRGRTAFFVNKNAELVQDNPRQEQINFQQPQLAARVVDINLAANEKGI